MRKVILRRPSRSNPYMKAYTAAVKNGSRGLHIASLKDGWVVKKVKSSWTSHIFEKKEDAVKFATKIAKDQKAELIIHGKDGRIRERNSYCAGN